MLRHQMVNLIVNQIVLRLLSFFQQGTLILLSLNLWVLVGYQGDFHTLAGPHSGLVGIIPVSGL